MMIEKTNRIIQCLEEILEIFSLQKIILKFDLLDSPGDIDDYPLVDPVLFRLPDQVVYKNQSIGELPKPTRKYYDFCGWYLSFNKQSKINDSFVVVNDTPLWSNEISDWSIFANEFSSNNITRDANEVTLYAKWSLKFVDVKLNPCGGYVFPETISVRLFDRFSNYPELKTSAAIPVKKNSVFKNWITSGNETVDTGTVLQPDVTELFAQYETEKYKVTFDYQDSSVKNVTITDEDTSILCRETLPLLFDSGETLNLVESRDIHLLPENTTVQMNFIEDTNLSATGKRFKGWVPGLRNNPNTQFTVFINDDVTLYPYWEPSSYTIEYKQAQDDGVALDREIVYYNTAIQLKSVRDLFANTTVGTEIDTENFYWYNSATTHFPAGQTHFRDCELVENLVSEDGATVTFSRYSNSSSIDRIPETITINHSGLTNTAKKFIHGEIFKAKDFKIFLSDGRVVHPRFISPSVFDANSTTKVSCWYNPGDDASSAIRNTFAEISVSHDMNDDQLIDVEFHLENMKTSYEYGERFDLNDCFVTEKYSNGTEKQVFINEFQENFIMYPERNTILKKPGLVFFGYKSIRDGSIWPHVSTNVALWDNLAISKSYTLTSTGEKSLIISKLPNKRNYIEGEKLSLDGIAAIVEMTTGERISVNNILEECDITPSVNSGLLPTTNSVTLTLKRNREISATYDISVAKKSLINFSLSIPENSSFSNIYNSTINSVSDISITGINAILEFDSGVVTTVPLDQLNQISLFSKNLTEIPENQHYGEITIHVYYSPDGSDVVVTNESDFEKTFHSTFVIKKLLPTKLFEFFTSTDEDAADFSIHNLRCTSVGSGQIISLECYNDIPENNTDLPGEVVFTNIETGTFKDTIRISKNTYHYFIVKTTEIFNSDLEFVESAKSLVTFSGPSVQDLYFDNQTINFINTNISKIYGFVPEYTFYDSKKDSITILNSVKFIADRGFFGAENITEISIPANTNQIGEYAFANCPKLCLIKFKKPVTNVSGLPEIFANTFGTTAKDFTGNEVFDADLLSITEAGSSTPIKKSLVIQCAENSKEYYSTYVAGETNYFQQLFDPKSRPAFNFYLTDSTNIVFV